MGYFASAKPAVWATINTGGIKGIGFTTKMQDNAIGASNAWVTANLAVYIPLVIEETITVVKMSIRNGATMAGTNHCDVGIYDSSANGKPFRRLVSSGSTVNTGVSTIQTLDIIDTVLTPGLYYLALALDNNSDHIWGRSNGVSEASGAPMFSQSSAFALPATATPVQTTVGLMPVIALHQGTTV